MQNYVLLLLLFHWFYHMVDVFSTVFSRTEFQPICQSITCSTLTATFSLLCSPAGVSCKLCPVPKKVEKRRARLPCFWKQHPHRLSKFLLTDPDAEAWLLIWLFLCGIRFWTMFIFTILMLQLESSLPKSLACSWLAYCSGADCWERGFWLHATVG